MAAIGAVAMCIMFVTVDMGQPQRVWHMMPLVGRMNFPHSLLIWDVIALSGYLAINLVLVGYALYRHAAGKEYRLKVILPLILLSIPWAVSIHTVTAFLFNGLSSRPFWNASILAPRFLASAFCSGPAIMIILFEVMRKYAGLKIEERAFSKIAELVAYTIGINLFLLGAEVFKEFYSGSVHLAPLRYLYFGLDGHARLAPLAWIALILNVLAFFIFLAPGLRRNALPRNIGALLIIVGIYIEKGMGFVVPGFIPDTLGEIYEYWPSWSELIIALGIWAAGALFYTVMAKLAFAALPGAVGAQDA
jgi:molybdopterin-containing oxidoreductase family membrane subunit